MVCRGSLVLLAFAASACGDDAAEQRTRAAAKEQWVQRVTAELDAPLKSRSWKVGENEVVAFEAPYSTSAGRYVERKRCVVWRDTEFKTSSISCGGPDELDLESLTTER